MFINIIKSFIKTKKADTDSPDGKKLVIKTKKEDLFNIAFGRVIAHEAGYSNNPADPGGETMHGITIKVARDHGYPGAMRDLPLEKAEEIYKASYWDVNKCGDLPFPLAFQLFDAAVNHGNKQAVKFLQRALDVEADGVIGPKTISAATKKSTLCTLMLFLQHRLSFYTSLKTFSTFGRGWVNRVAVNLRYGVIDAEDYGFTK